MLFFQVFDKKANELSVLMIFIHLPQKAKSMQPRDFEDDLASSAERFAKKKKKLEMDRLKSTETTERVTLSGIYLSSCHKELPYIKQ